MPNFDRFSCVIVSQYGGNTYNNIVYGQILDEANPATALTGFGNLVLDKVVDNLVKAVVDRMNYVNLVVRRLKPAITDVEVLAINRSGDLPQRGQPGTVYTLVRYFASPYEAGTAFHWKFNGVADSSAKRGLMTNQGVTRFTALVEGITLGPYVQDNNTYDFIRPPRNTDPAGQALPQIYKAQVDNTLRNLRSRQIRIG